MWIFKIFCISFFSWFRISINRQYLDERDVKEHCSVVVVAVLHVGSHNYNTMNLPL